MESWIGFVRSRFNEISLNNGLLNCSIERKHGDYQMVPKKRDEKLSRLRNVFKLEEEKKSKDASWASEREYIEWTTGAIVGGDLSILSTVYIETFTASSAGAELHDGITRSGDHLDLGESDRLSDWASSRNSQRTEHVRPTRSDR